MGQKKFEKIQAQKTREIKWKELIFQFWRKIQWAFFVKLICQVLIWFYDFCSLDFSYFLFRCGNDITFVKLFIFEKWFINLGDCRAKISEKQTSIIQQETELQTVKFKTDPNSINRMFSVKKVMDGLKKDVNELRCVEQKLSRQLELIQKPLREQSKS